MGPVVFFYSHQFDDTFLDCVANKKDPIKFTQIQRYVPIVNDKPLPELALYDAKERKVIIEILDAIQQILSA